MSRENRTEHSRDTGAGACGLTLTAPTCENVAGVWQGTGYQPGPRDPSCQMRRTRMNEKHPYSTHPATPLLVPTILEQVVRILTGFGDMSVYCKKTRTQFWNKCERSCCCVEPNRGSISTLSILEARRQATRAGTLLTGAAQKAWVWILNIDPAQANAGLTAFQSATDLPSFDSQRPRRELRPGHMLCSGARHYCGRRCDTLTNTTDRLLANHLQEHWSAVSPRASSRNHASMCLVTRRSFVE